MDLFNFIPSFDANELTAHAEKAHQARKAQFLGNNRFIASSLGAWLEEVAIAGLAHVPAKKIFSMPYKEFFNEEEAPKAWVELNQALSEVPKTDMVRWDPASGLELKDLMDSATPELRTNYLGGMDDPRAVDIIFEYPADEIPVWSRPWHKALLEGSHPVEFRVFVQDSKVIGVANYYIQRSLPDKPQTHTFIKDCITQSERLIASLVARDRMPWMASYEGAGLNPKTVNATLDFLICSQTLRAVFLEAGPAYGAGAHPCAFMGAAVSGVALGTGAAVPGIAHQHPCNVALGEY